MLFLVLLSIICTKKAEKRCREEAQLVAEMFVGFINKFYQEHLGGH